MLENKQISVPVRARSNVLSGLGVDFGSKSTIFPL